MIVYTKCMSCKYDVIDESNPQDTCKCHPKGIPSDVWEVLMGDNEAHEKCKEYKFNPNWDD